MTSVCSSPPNHYSHAPSSTSPIVNTTNTLSHHQHQKSNDRTASSSRAIKPAVDDVAGPLHLPRGHDSSDVAAFSKSLEENASMTSRMAKATAEHQQHQSHKSSAGTSVECATLKQALPSFDDEEDPQGPFEGPEKLLELWFADSQSDVKGGGLKEIDRKIWENMLDIVKCKVLSTIERHNVDAYLLSESSMFVFPHKLILKTCGTTTLLLGLERILQIAYSVFGQETCHVTSAETLGKLVKQCFYSRKSFMFPERQKGPHKDWLLEVGLLDRFFEQGSAYTVGKMNGDHWLLYMTSAQSNATKDTSIGRIRKPLRMPAPLGHRGLSDQTLEILMTHLSPTSCSRFVFPADANASVDVKEISSSSNNDKGHQIAAQLSDQLGLTSLFPGTTMDAFAFEPCGYSANAIVSDLKQEGESIEDAYWTVHVTPEEGSSYASFETNVHMDETGQDGAKDLPWLISRALSIFEPSRMSVTLFMSSCEEDDIDRKTENRQNQCDVLHGLQLANYKRTDRIAYEFEEYDLVFVSFDREGVQLPKR